MPLVLAPLLIPGLVFFAALVLIALAQTFNAWGGSSTQTGNSGGLLGLMTAVVRIAVNPVSGVIGVAKSGIERLARETVSRWALNHVKPITRWFASLHSLVDGTFARLEALATETARRFEHIIAVALPREIARAVTDIRALARDGVRIGHQALARARALESEIARLRRHVASELASLTAAADAAVAKEFGRARAAERSIASEIPASLRARLEKIEKYIAAGAIAAVIVRVIAKRFPWLFCRQVQTVGKQVCGMDSDLLSSLLTDALLIGGTLSLVEFAKEMQAVTGASVGLIRDFWQAN